MPANSLNPRACAPPQMRMLEWIARIGAGTADALAHAHGASIASVRARLAAAERERVVVRRRPLSGLPALYTLTSPGLRACGRAGGGTCRVGASNALHLIACAGVAAALERCYPDHAVIGERELRRGEHELGRPLASARLAPAPADGSHGESSLPHRPDLVLLPRDPGAGELPVAVEVELTVKAPRRLTAICRAWARCRDVAGVLYLAAPAAERPLERAIAQADAGREVVVAPLAALPGLMLDLGQ